MPLNNLAQVQLNNVPTKWGRIPYIKYSSFLKADFTLVSKIQRKTEKQSYSSLVITKSSKRDNSYYTDKDTAASQQKVVSITYEEIGLFPRSFSRVLDRFLKQLFSDVDNLVIQEYRFYRYLFLTTIKTIFILLFLPFLVNFAAKNYLVKPITEYFWNTSHPEIFLNSYEQKRAFAELENFEEKIYFETLVESNAVFDSSLIIQTKTQQPNNLQLESLQIRPPRSGGRSVEMLSSSVLFALQQQTYSSVDPITPLNKEIRSTEKLKETSVIPISNNKITNTNPLFKYDDRESAVAQQQMVPSNAPHFNALREAEGVVGAVCGEATRNSKNSIWPAAGQQREPFLKSILKKEPGIATTKMNLDNVPTKWGRTAAAQQIVQFLNKSQKTPTLLSDFSIINRETFLKSLQNIRKFKDRPTAISKIYQEKMIELATYYNNHSIEAITNFFADLLSLCTLLYLLITLSIQINITKSFLLEVFFGLDDSKKSLLILLITDLLVGYHSSNLWELFFEFIFNHYGIPESQTSIFLLVATLPVLLDVLFKYLIFRHLNRSSPATVATYQAIIE
uniref:Envelope membrane protein n=1 Tax=Pandorina morum TaxID=33099 RepID=A0A6C0RVU9_PANMO|nr:envelope membrane protein [Pandorina morum]